LAVAVRIAPKRRADDVSHCQGKVFASNKFAPTKALLMPTTLPNHYRSTPKARLARLTAQFWVLVWPPAVALLLTTSFCAYGQPSPDTAKHQIGKQLNSAACDEIISCRVADRMQKPRHRHL